VITHPRAQLGDDFERPILPGTELLKHLFLLFQLIFLVMAGNRGRDNRRAICGIGSIKPLGAQLRQVIPPMIASRMFSNQPAFKDSPIRLRFKIATFSF